MGLPHRPNWIKRREKGDEREKEGKGIVVSPLESSWAKILARKPSKSRSPLSPSRAVPSSSLPSTASSTSSLSMKEGGSQSGSGKAKKKQKRPRRRLGPPTSQTTIDDVKKEGVSTVIPENETTMNVKTKETDEKEDEVASTALGGGEGDQKDENSDSVTLQEETLPPKNAQESPISSSPLSEPLRCASRLHSFLLRHFLVPNFLTEVRPTPSHSPLSYLLGDFYSHCPLPSPLSLSSTPIPSPSLLLSHLSSPSFLIQFSPLFSTPDSTPPANGQHTSLPPLPPLPFPLQDSARVGNLCFFRFGRNLVTSSSSWAAESFSTCLC